MRKSCKVTGEASAEDVGYLPIQYTKLTVFILVADKILLYTPEDSVLLVSDPLYKTIESVAEDIDMEQVRSTT
jgi:hypothetical protein